MWVERGYLKPPKDYNLLKLFPMKQQLEDYPGYNFRKKLDTRDPFTRLKQRFLQKYPEHMDVYEGKSFRNPHLMDTFVKKQFNLIKQGFNELKAFEMVEKEMASIVESEKTDRLLVEGISISNRSRSLMTVFEQREEFIQRQKKNRIERELPEFLRSEYMKNTPKKELEKQPEGRAGNRKQINYNPISYYLSNKKELVMEDDHKKENFLRRSETLINFYHSYSEVSDGLSMSSERNINRLARESSFRFKNHHRNLLNKLNRHNVTLNEHGKINYSFIKSDVIKGFVKRNQSIVSVLLLSKDLDFEIPHQQRMSEIKQEIQKEIQEEEERLKEIFAGREKAREEEIKQKKDVIDYEEIFGIDRNYGTRSQIMNEEKVEKQLSDSRYLLSYEDWEDDLKDSEKGINLFQKDLEYKKYFYTESLKDKEVRLRELWLKTKTNRDASNISENPTFKPEFLEIRKDISNLIRSLRRNIDQYLIKNGVPPYFGNKIRFYDREEFLYDSEINFHQIKRFLSKKSSILKNDPSISYNYLDLIETLNKKKLLENSIANFEKVKAYDPNEAIEKEEKESDRMVTSIIMDKDEEVIEILKESGNDFSKPAKEKKGSSLKNKLLEHFENQIKESMTVSSTGGDGEEKGEGHKRKGGKPEKLKLKEDKVKDSVVKKMGKKLP
eukprot:CAMPEP_0170516848 /NCGR_PEP_ID=MMETSP0209-20121228/2972_1 /TAXON_ID=665100 ORGANISM="Litonotus pictus, Strain P1" /NCGR_SAMPLE_ID=MMETSP0209 /ASSEMBLY_ACC=CAM_ASM_000301 /LENGTH=667 /DNA_ID=CAMNT_0010801909 /DNA_START=57 /DNA_END=2056 /DNA_ORIENTATION=+